MNDDKAEIDYLLEALAIARARITALEAELAALKAKQANSDE